MNIQRIASVISEFKYLDSKEEKIGAMAMMIDDLRKQVELAKLDGMQKELAAVKAHTESIAKQNEKLAEIMGV